MLVRLALCMADYVSLVCDFIVVANQLLVLVGSGVRIVSAGCAPNDTWTPGHSSFYYH